MTAAEIRDRLADLEERDPAAADVVRDAWPHTLAALDEPDGSVVEIPGAPPIRQPIETLRAQLAAHLDDLGGDDDA